jgi:hypothetical protein
LGKEAPNLSSTKGITPRFEEEKSLPALQPTKGITFKFRISTEFLGICDYFIKNSMLYFN